MKSTHLLRKTIAQLVVEGRDTIARALLDQLATLGETAGDHEEISSAAARQRRYRENKRNARDASGVTLDVTEGITRDVTGVTLRAVPLSDSPNPKEKLDSDSSSLSLPLGSLQQGSDQEQAGATRDVTQPVTPAVTASVTRKRDASATRCPASNATPEEIAAWCAKWRVPLPSENPEAAHWLDHHRAKGSKMVDWHACWGTWTRKSKQFAQQRVANGRSVQPVDPNAPWMRDDHGRW